MNKLGKIKIVVGRTRDYFSLVQFGMVSWLFFERVEWSWWWGLGVVIFGLFMIYDYRKILPSEYAAGMELNPEWKRVTGGFSTGTGENPVKFTPTTSFMDVYDTVQK